MKSIFCLSLRGYSRGNPSPLSSRATTRDPSAVFPGLLRVLQPSLEAMAWRGAMTAVVVIAGFALGAKPAHALTLRNTSNNLGLVGYWSLNEGVGTKATDFSGRGNTGTLTNMEAGDWVAGKRGKALTFDGVDEYVQLGGDDTFKSLTQGTISIWFKISADSIIFSEAPKSTISQGLFLWLTALSDGSVSIRQRNADSDALYATSATGLFSLNTWNNLIYTVDSSGHKMYLNGQLLNLNYVAGIGSSYFFDDIPTTQNYFIGGKYSSLTVNRFVTGSIDDVRIYNRALSATEISNMYNAGQAVIKAKDNTGLVGYWPMDEGTSTTAGDFSGNGNTCTKSGSPPWVAGKRGYGLDFERDSSQALSCGSAASLDDIEAQGGGGLSGFFWYKPETTSLTTYPFNKNGGATTANGTWNLSFNSAGRLEFFKSYSTTLLRRRASSLGLTAGLWHYAGFTWDGSATATNVKFYVNGVETSYDSTVDGVGSKVSDAANTLAIGITWAGTDGILDDVRLYNRVLSAAEVANLYASSQTANPRITTVSRNGLVGYWSLDEGTSTSAGDFSGNGNTGTLTNMEAADWVAGKRGQGLSLGGTDEYVSIATTTPIYNSTDMSISAWIKQDAYQSSNRYGIVGTTSSNAGLIMVISGAAESGGGGLIESCDSVGCWGVKATTPIILGSWNHVAITAVSSAGKIYLNGSLITSGTVSRTSATSTISYRIGSSGGGASGPFAGQIDEVRIYNRALSASEIQTLYNTGR